MKKNIVVLTGAGVSAESGLKTFRDSDGLWEGHRVDDVATPEAWYKDREAVLRFYNERRKNVRDAHPNAAHKALADLQEDYEVHIVTQNIDDLHERAGSKNVLHLHGEIFKMRSENEEHLDELSKPITEDIFLGDLAEDGGQYRPHIVWFGEAVNAIEMAIPIMQQADIFILVGTSLVVYPAAGLVDFLPPYCKKFVVDRVIPPVHHIRNIVPITMPASTGVLEVVRLLKEGKD